MRFIKYIAVVGIVLVAAAVAAVTTGGVELPKQIPLAGAESETAQVATVTDGIGEIAAFDSSEGGSEIARFAAETEYGTRTAFEVIGDGGERVEVRLPGRPNGRIGFVDSDAVVLSSVQTAIDVDLAARRLQVTRDGEVVLETQIAIGSAEYPTPTGDYYVTDKLRSDDPAYGDWAFGISAWSDQLTDFNGGSGQIGIHGTNNPSSIGKDVSHGCMRVDNETAIALSGLIEVGTSVTIH
jgi:lipoprotein-anchoring transpeptidase ErfK/SrfK